jgi:hypothetical protein
MALQGEGQISFSNIAGELGSSTPYSLRGMSDFAGFSSPDAMSEFYGYDAGGGGGGPTLTQFWITASFEDPRDACFLSCETPAWHNGSQSTPVAGDSVYGDSAGMLPLSGPFYGMYEAQYGPAKTTIFLKGSNTVVSTTQC